MADRNPLLYNDESISSLAEVNYLSQGGYVFIVVTSTIVIVIVCLSVCLLATLRKNFRTDLHEIFREGWQWANEKTIKFW